MYYLLILLLSLLFFFCAIDRIVTYLVARNHKKNEKYLEQWLFKTTHSYNRLGFLVFKYDYDYQNKITK